MQVTMSQEEGVIIARLDGELDSRTTPQIQGQLLPLVQPGSRLLIDMRGVEYMSSAGLRFLLVLYRRLAEQEGRVVLVGLSEALEDTMSITGFLDFFERSRTVDDGLAKLRLGISG